jgi:hypothetical protein
MITTGEARRVAEEWVRGRVGGLPELVGVMLGGSARQRAPSAPHPESSDVDVFIWVDARVPSDIEQPRHRYSPTKLLHRGVVLEPSFHDAQRIADPEAVLGNPNLAPAFADPLLLLDPAGRLAAVAAAVTPAVNRRRHVERRLAAAAAAVAAHGTRPAAPDLPNLKPCWRHAAFVIGVVKAAQLPLVADLRYPTMRRAFAVAREVLAEAGRVDLADALLRLLGSAALTRADVAPLQAELAEAYDLAVAARRTPVVMDWNVSPDARALEHAGIRELVEGGHPREAMFQLLLVRTAVQGILENDGGQEALARSRAGYRRLLAALGIDGDEPFFARAAALQAFLPELREGCEEILARNPRVVE